MAIFRAGKRIGPFDIRGGISRGDYKSSAYHKTDRDPRFKQHANTDNTIGRFRAAMASAEGYARPARYAIRIFPPSALRQAVKMQNATTNRDGQTLDNEMYNGDGQVNFNSSGRVLNQLTQTIGRQVNIHCDTVTMPGRDLLQQEVQYGTDVKRQMVQTHTYEGNIAATFYADKYMRERQFMEAWQNLCVDPIRHEANYYDDYVGKMQIFQLGSLDGEGDRDVPTYGIEAIKVFPQTLSAVEYNYGSSNQLVKINVGFAYKQWYNLTTDHISGMTFGNSMQTIHDVKSPDTGLFGRLPIELQRAGRDVFNSAKNQIPIGRLFKGKLFPPFT